MKSVARWSILGGLIAFAAAGSVQAQQLTEGFEGAFPPTGWIVRNQSTAVGLNTACWNQFTGATPWAANTGTSHAGANFNCEADAGAISGWLISSQLTMLQNGNTVSFFTRGAAPASGFADRLELRLCLDVAAGSCGLAGSTGTSPTDVGGFTNLILSVNAAQAPLVYPAAYTQFSAQLSGLPAGVNPGRVALRYSVTSAGPNGANSNILSVDDVVVSSTVPVTLQNFSVD